MISVSRIKADTLSRAVETPQLAHRRARRRLLGEVGTSLSRSASHAKAYSRTNSVALKVRYRMGWAKCWSRIEVQCRRLQFFSNRAQPPPLRGTRPRAPTAGRAPNYLRPRVALLLVGTTPTYFEMRYAGLTMGNRGRPESILRGRYHWSRGGAARKSGPRRLNCGR